MRSSKISPFMAALMVGTALLFDAAQILLSLTGVGAVATPIITVTALTLFALWFLLLGVNYLGGRKAGIKIAAVLGTTFVELVPIINILMVCTIALGVATVIYATWKEEEEKREEAKRALQKTKEEEARQERLAAARAQAAMVRERTQAQAYEDA